MPYQDATVYVEDRAGDQGFDPASTAPFWLSPDVDIPAHTGVAFQGSNTVQIRVHTHEEPILDDKIVAEVYAGTPGFALSPVAGTRRIDPGGLLFRPPNVAGTEPVADIAGGTLTFSWTPSSATSDPDGPGHRCLIVRAFPQSITPPTDPFDPLNEQHEAQHNLEILSTTKSMGGGRSAGAGTPQDPRRRDKQSGMWWERFATLAGGKPGKRYVAWAFDPDPVRPVRRGLPKGTQIAKEPPKQVTLEPDPKYGEPIDPRDLLKDGPFIEESGFGRGLFAEDRLLAGAVMELDQKEVRRLVLRFDHSNLEPPRAVVLHGVQWDESGRAEGGMTVVALAAPSASRAPAASPSGPSTSR